MTPSIYTGVQKLRDEVEKISISAERRGRADRKTNQEIKNSYPGFSSGRPRGTTPADDRYIVLHARRNRRQTAEKSLDTRHRRLDRYRVLPWPEDSTVVVCLHDALYGVPLTPSIGEGVSVVPGTPELRDNEWDEYFYR
ncbi:hypothetical protein TNCV_3501291 [Trichonephila clavipes]|nr:hypothetical protein TNCV_3501291 [Trichonephila clavipes]